MDKENFSWYDEEELKAENDFLKLKLMLENGAEFHTMSGMGLPPEIENRFLKNIASFEEQWARQKTITVFEKIEKPSHFPPVSSIPDERIDGLWRSLWDYLQEYGIHVDHCSPRVSTRELYRFTTEELFQQEIEDIDVPGMIRGFIYDEFHPDPAFDLCILVENMLFWNIFQKGETHINRLFPGGNFIFNEMPPLDTGLFAKMIDDFKDHFVELNLKHFNVDLSEVEGNRARLKGAYVAEALTSSDLKYFEGGFRVDLEKEEEVWQIRQIKIEGFDPQLY
jgi:hypothetical protein